MDQRKIFVAKNAEEAFEACARRFRDGPDETRPLTSEVRRLAVARLCRTAFPRFSISDVPGWEETAARAEAMERDEERPFADYLPGLLGEGLEEAEVLSKIGFFYERLKDFEARKDQGSIQVRPSSIKRKRTGTYFTPLSVCSFMARKALDPFLKMGKGDREALLRVQVLDPAMGTGQFLLAAAELLVHAMEPEDGDDVRALRQRLFERSLYGIELDGENADIARLLLGLYLGKPGHPLPGLRKGDALIDDVDEGLVFGEVGFPERFFDEKEEPFDGFDAILGNPPYLAAKNESFARYKPLLGNSTQADFYLLFIQKYAVKKYLKPGGGISLIVPDPLLLRANAEGARTRLLDGLDLELLLHIKGVFPRTSVANVILLARRPLRERNRTVCVLRVEKSSRVQSFRRDADALLKRFSREIPLDYFRRLPRKEFRYLLSPASMKVLKNLDAFRPPFQETGMVIRPLQSLASAKGAIFRGEEVGKDRVRAKTARDPSVGLPMLVGGENILKYALRDDGLFIPEAEVKKDKTRYQRSKIVIQKSTGRIVAALDDRGYVVPQSVYGILVDDPRIGYPFLLTQLNSRLLNYFMHVMFTGYKLLQPQIEIEDIRRIPVMVPVFQETREARNTSLDTAKSLFSQYLRTDDPGWVLEYVDDSLKLGSSYGSAMLHDLLDFLGGRMIDASSGRGDETLSQDRLEWLIDLVVYRVFGLGLEEIETVEGFFEGSGEGAESEPAPLVNAQGSYGIIPEGASIGLSMQDLVKENTSGLFQSGNE